MSKLVILAALAFLGSNAHFVFRPLPVHQVVTDELRFFKKAEKMDQTKRPKFMGIELRDPQYYALQNEAIALDRDLKRLAMENSLGTLIRSPYWIKSVLVMRRLVPLVPEDIKQENQQVAWWLVVLKKES